MGDIKNRVKQSSLISLDLKDYYTSGERIELDFGFFLEEGILFEKKFRKKLLEFNWKSFEEKFVYVTCEDELIIPSWAYVLLSYYLSKNCKDFVFGDIKSLEEKLYLKKISSVNVSQYKNQRVIIKGCSEIPFPEYVYFELTKRLTPFVYSLMYGEPCSTVPIFKNKN